MILAMRPATYLSCVQAFSSAGNSSPRRLDIEDQQLQTPPLISIIDDDESMRCAVKSLVTSLGLNARTFASAEEFLRSSQVEHTSCLITDLQMPGLNGVELQKMLLAQDRHIPIIFMTAFPEERLRTRAIEAGALGFLSKPFESQMLINLIEKAIEISRKE
jgi:FixJ family two-component response regulator